MAGIEADMAKVSRAHAEVVSRLQLDQITMEIPLGSPGSQGGLTPKKSPQGSGVSEGRNSPLLGGMVLTPRTATLRGAPTDRERKGGLTWRRPDSRQGSEAGSRPGSSRGETPVAVAASRNSSSLGFNLNRSSSRQGGTATEDNGDKAMSEIKKAMAASTKSTAETMASLFSHQARPTTAEAQQRAKAKARRGMRKR